MKYRYIILLGLLAVVGWIYTYQLKPTLHAITAYGAKCACTNIFFSGRDLTDIQNEDLDPAVVPITISRDGDVVTASTLLGLASSSAIRNNGRGCVLLYDGTTPLKSAYKTYPREVDTTYTLLKNVQEVRTEHRNIDYDRLDAAVDRLFDQKDKKKIQTRSLIMLYKGEVIAEQYADNETRKTAMITYALDDYLTSIIIGMMVHDKLISIDDKNLFPEWKEDERKNISLENLMRMNSGLKWDEQYGILNDVSKLLFVTPNTYEYAVQSVLAHPIGTTYNYSSGNVTLIYAYLSKQFPSNQDFHNYVETRVLKKLGLSSVIMETDAAGYYIPGFTYATSRDIIKMALLIKQDGLWEGKRLLPEGWIKFSNTLTPGSNGTYGALFSSNYNTEHLPTAPTSMIYNRGFQGQFGFILPDQDLVILRMGFKEKHLDLKTFFSEIMEIF